MVDASQFNAFADDANLGRRQDPWYIRKPKDGQYAQFIIGSCQNEGWWYAKYVGIEFTGQIRYDYHKQKQGIICINDIIVVRLTGSKYIEHGRNIDPKDVIMV